MANRVKDIKADLRDRRADRKRERARKKSLAEEGRKRKRTIVAKAVACAVVVLVCLFFALIVGDAEYKATMVGWVPLFMVVLGIAAAFGYVQVLKRSISFSETPASFDCKRGDDIRFDVAFRNKSPLFFFRIETYFFISDLYGNVASRSMTTMALGPFEKMTMGFNTTFEHIGTYTAGLERLVISDFLGLFTATIENDTKRRVNVTPNLQLLDGIQFSNDAMLETSKAAKSVIADSMDYSHVRDYEIGDPLKTIHWNLSARTGTYMTRLYEMYTNPGVGIIMDFYGPSDEAEELMSMFDAVVECAFSLGKYAREKGMDTEVFFRDKHGSSRRLSTWDEDQLPSIIDDMPTFSNDPKDAAGAMDILNDQVVSQYGQSNIIMVSANVDSQLVSMVVEAKLQRRAPMMIAVVSKGLDGRALDAYCKSLSRLDAADIPYLVVSRSADLVKAGE